jgi:nucleolar protein 9
MKNVFAEKSKDKDMHTPVTNSTPRQFQKAAANFVRILRDELGENEVRALAADKVASPVLQVRMAEALEGLIVTKGRLLRRV